MAWKYIMIKNTMPGGTEFLLPVIFPDKMVHYDVFAHLRSSTPAWNGRGEVTAHSAGKIEHVYAEGVGGDSETLKLKAGKNDANIILRYSYFHGILK